MKIQCPEIKITLTNGGELILYDSKNTELWKASSSSTNNNKPTCAAMLDSGNFVIINEDSTPAWESFNEPTDTILPGQTLKIDNPLKSRQSDTNFTNGRFQLHMQGGYIYVERGNQNVFNLTQKGGGSSHDNYLIARIDYDGAFRLYKHPRNSYTTGVGSCSSSWSAFETYPPDVCMIMGSLGSGACGFNSYCVNDNGRPNCSCPEGYSFLNPFDRKMGCKPNFQLPSCQKDGWETNFDRIEFKELNSTDWPLADYELQTGVEVDKETCKRYCLIDCFCAAAIHNGNNCWKKKFPLSNGRQSSDVNRTALIKVPIGDANQWQYKKDKSTLILVGSLLLGSSVFLNFLLLLAVSVAVFISYHKKMQDLQPGMNTFGMNVRRQINYSMKPLAV
ncbi:unnamed protein product [Ilex paraguariensis]|uniref:Bulb-type lectin domain-containing protein n=1 Tax=Ilex paraguariensis TaxID=185542 RepID=A0ABC8RV17_9AQUA